MLLITGSARMVTQSYTGWGRGINTLFDDPQITRLHRVLFPSFEIGIFVGYAELKRCLVYDGSTLVDESFKDGSGSSTTSTEFENLS